MIRLTEARTTRLGRSLMVALALGLAACASSDRPKPKPLEPIATPLATQEIWRNTELGSVDFPITVLPGAQALVVADSSGRVQSVSRESGAVLWRFDAREALSAGVGSDGQTAAVVTRQGELLALREGRLIWRQAVGARVSTAPLVAGGRVFVLAQDRSVQAFDADDGRKLWAVARPGDALTLAHVGVLTSFGNTLIAGQGVRLAGMDPDSGRINWEVPLATPRGTNEVERLADVVGPVARVDKLLCARAFQAAVACVDAERVALQWSKLIGGSQGVAAETARVVAADASDRISAWKLASGELLWSTDQLQYRSLQTPWWVGSRVLFSDADGVVHVLSGDQGRALARIEGDGSPVIARVTSEDGRWFVLTRKGRLSAWRFTAP